MNDIYAYTVPVFVKHLGGLRNVLLKAQAFIREKGMSESELLASALAPDMYPLSRQVQIACDNAKGATARLAGADIPKKEDGEKTIDELLARIGWTLEFVQSIPESAFEGAEGRKITLPYFKDTYMTGFDYAREYAVPNFLFHVVTAYGLVRKAGAQIGKGDYMNGYPTRPL